MGYTTDFTGHVSIEPPLNEHEIAYLRRFSESRRMQRQRGPYCTGTGPYGQDRESDVTDYNHPPVGQPGLWCNWTVSDDGARIEWNGSEKFYYSDEWMRYVIDTFLAPEATLKQELANRTEGRHYPEEFAHFTFNHVTNGVIDAAGEDETDRWRLSVRDNVVERIEVDLANGDPAIRALIDAGWLGYPDDEITPENLAEIVELVRSADQRDAA